MTLATRLAALERSERKQAAPWFCIEWLDKQLATGLQIDRGQASNVVPHLCCAYGRAVRAAPGLTSLPTDRQIRTIAEREGLTSEDAEAWIALYHNVEQEARRLFGVDLADALAGDSLLRGWTEEPRPRPKPTEERRRERQQYLKSHGWWHPFNLEWRPDHA